MELVLIHLNYLQALNSIMIGSEYKDLNIYSLNFERCPNLLLGIWPTLF